MTAVTTREGQVLRFIQDHIAEKGYPPTTREIAKSVGLASSSAVHKQLNHLERDGFIERDGGARALRLTAKGGAGELLWQAYLEGWMQSGEGWNADCAMSPVLPELRKRFEEWNPRAKEEERPDLSLALTIAAPGMTWVIGEVGSAIEHADIPRAVDPESQL